MSKRIPPLGEILFSIFAYDGISPNLETVIVVPLYRKLPPLLITCRVVGTELTCIGVENDTLSVSPAVLKLFCTLAPGTDVPFWDSVKPIVFGNVPPVTEVSPLWKFTE